MAIDITTEIVIDRPCAEVAAYAGDPGNAPLWYDNIDSVTSRTPPPVGVGSKMDFVNGRDLAKLKRILEAGPVSS